MPSSMYITDLTETGESDVTDLTETGGERYAKFHVRH